MKKCRYCAEEIQEAAIVCKHCGHDIELGTPSLGTNTRPQRDQTLTIDRRKLLGSTAALMVGGAIANRAQAQCPQPAGAVDVVKDFGAKGNNTQDDSSSIQNALDSSGYVFFPPGVYKVTQPLEVRSGQSLVGSGMGSVDVANSCNGTQLRMVGGGSSSLLTNGTNIPSEITIDNLSVVYVNSPVGSAAIDLPHLRSAALSNVGVFNDKGDALRVLQTDPTTTSIWLNSFFNCYFRSDNGQAVFFEGTDSEFVGCYFTGGPNKDGGGVLSQRQAGNRFIGCQFSRASASSSGLEIRLDSNLAGQASSNGSLQTSIVGCYFDECKSWALKFNNAIGAQNNDADFLCNVNGCTFRGNPAGDVLLENVGGVAIVGSTFFFGAPGSVRIKRQGNGSNLLCTNNLVKGTINIPTGNNNVVTQNVIF